MAIDPSAAYEWTRIALRQTDTDLTDDELEALTRSSMRRLLQIYPLILTTGTADLSALTTDDKDAFFEAVGFLVAARWVMLPRPDGSEIVKRFKIGQLEESYSVANLDELLALFRDEARDSIHEISFISAAILAAYTAGSLGKAKLVVVNPARWQAAQFPSQGGALNLLFSKRQLGLVGVEPDPDEVMGANYSGGVGYYGDGLPQ